MVEIKNLDNSVVISALKYSTSTLCGLICTPKHICFSNMRSTWNVKTKASQKESGQPNRGKNHDNHDNKNAIE